MSISIDGYSPVYHPTPAPTEPKPEAKGGSNAAADAAAEAAAALREAIAAAKRALEAARAAQAEAEKAKKALDDNKDATKKDLLQGDYDSKQATAEQSWSDLKVATKQAYAAGDPKNPDAVTQQLKDIDSKDDGWSKRVDEAKGEPPDLAIVASGHKDSDAAARRVSGAYASGGDAAATKQLRAELERAKTPEQRQAILRSAMPVVDKVTKDLGENARHTEGEWNHSDADAAKKGAIDTRSEFDHTVADLEASVELAGDKEAAFHIAHDILQVMPGGDRANSANNLLGLLGQDLGQSSPNKTSMLETAMSAALVQPDAKGHQGSMLAMPLDQRDQAARLLAPDRSTTVTIHDWTDEQGVKHDGSLWHEVEQNPDLLLTAQQRADIDKKTQGWSADEVLKEKTSRAIDNLREQNPGQDVDNAKCGETFSYQAEDPRKNLPQPLGKDVQTASDQSKGAHPDDLQYGVDLDKLTNSDAFRKLGADQQIEAIGQFDRSTTQAAKGGQPLADAQKDQLRDLLGSSSFHDINSRVQDRVLGLFSEFARSDAGRIDGLNKLVDHAGFRALDNETGEFQVLDAYQHDNQFRNAVDKLTGRTDLPPADARTSLDLLSRTQANRQLYDKADDGEKQKILDSVLQATTDPRFRAFAQNQKDATIDKLVKYGDEEYALEDGGVNTALDEAAKVKPTGPSGTQPVTPSTTPPTTTVAGPPTEVTIKNDLAKVEAGAHDTATSKATINDDLRRVASEDPVTYAFLKLQRDHKGDKAYLDLLTKAIPEHRRDYTKQQVSDLVAKGKPEEAMKLLRSNMDAAADPAERKQLWEAAGKPVFTPEHFSGQLDKIFSDDNKFGRSGQLAELFQQTGENAPPEVANLLLDAAKARLDKGHDDPLWQTLLSDGGSTGEAYKGLSELIETADSLGGHRADEFADFYVRAINDAAGDPQNNAQVLGFITGNAGLYTQTGKVIGEHGAAKLSVALYNAVKDRKGDPQDWSERAEANVRNQIRDGVKEFRDNAKGDVDAWQSDNKNALRLVQDFGSVDPKQVAQAIVQDRQKHPEKYFDLDDGKPTGIDVLQQQMEKRGVELDGLMRDLTGLKIDFDHPSVPAEKMLGDAIRDLDADEIAMSTLHGNVSLDTHRINQLNFGTFDGNASPWNPVAVVGAQRDYLDKVARDYHLTPDQVKQAGARTDQWEKDLKAEVAKGDKASEDTLRSLTNTYEKDLRGLLKDKMPAGQDNQVLVRPADDVVVAIKTPLQSIATGTSTFRLTMNWYKGTGDAIVNNYTKVALRRGLENADFNPRSQLVANAAWLGFTDKASVEKSFQFMEKWQAKIKAATDANNGILSDTDRAKLMADYKKELPTFGEPASTSRAAAEPLRAAERFTRLLGAACFFGSAYNNYVNAQGEKGVTSSDAFATFMLMGGAADTYRLVKGTSFEGGKLTDLLEKSWVAKAGPGAADDMARFIKNGGVGSLLTLADMEWAYEDFTGHTFLTDNPTGAPPDWRAGALTSGVVAGDFLDMGAMALRTQVGGALLRAALTEGAALAVEGAIPVIGWIGAGVTAAFLGARLAYSVTDEKNEFEYDDNHDYADMVKSLGFSDDQARELMNLNGGASDYRNDWREAVPGLKEWGDISSFFTEGGVSPMHVLNPLFDANGVPQEQRLQYLQSLTPDEMKNLVRQTHRILDDEMKDDGTITGSSTDGLEGWMRDNKLWKNEYLGAA